MKLGKEEIQKIVLGVIMVIIVIYVYFTMLLGPLEDGQRVTQLQLNELQPKIDDAKKQIKKTAELEIAAPKATLVVKELATMIPDGSPVAWFPPEVQEFFKREGIDKASTRMNNDLPEKDMPGFRRISWAVDLPKVEFAPLAQALADFENEELLAEIAGIQIETLREDPESQRVNLTVNNIVKQ